MKLKSHLKILRNSMALHVFKYSWYECVKNDEKKYNETKNGEWQKKSKINVTINTII